MSDIDLELSGRDFNDFAQVLSYKAVEILVGSWIVGFSTSGRSSKELDDFLAKLRYTHGIVLEFESKSSDY